jgi:hypothetical protein
MPASHRGGPGSNPGLVMWDFVMDESGTGAGFHRELRFPLPICIPSVSPQSSSLSPEAGTIGQESGRGANSLTNQNKKKDRGCTFLRNTGKVLPNYTASHFNILYSSVVMFIVTYHHQEHLFI